MHVFRDHTFLTGPGSRLSVRRPGFGFFALVITGLLAWILFQVAQDYAVTSLTPSLASKGTEVSTLPADSPRQLQPNYGQLPLQFEPNQGQTDPQVTYLARGAGYSLFLTPQGSLVALSKGPGEEESGAIVRMQLVAANPNPVMQGLSPLPGKANYLMGREPNDWHTNIPTYAQVVTRDVYPGIDLRYHGEQQQLEYDFIVHPGATVETIRMAFSGVEDVQLDPQGDLILQAGEARLYHRKPVIYQDIDGNRRPIDGGYEIKDNHQVGFQVAAYDSNYPLIIDPILDYSTYLGGEGTDTATDIAVDDTGHVYITGTTRSLAFPTVNAFQLLASGGMDSFIVKLSPTGDSMLYATYFGGSGNEGTGGQDNDSDKDKDKDSDDEEDDDEENSNPNQDLEQGPAIAVNSLGEVWIAGTTDSATDFPLVNAFQPVYGGGANDAFLVKLSVDGSSLLYSTFLGATGPDLATALVIDAAGQAIVAGYTQSAGFPVSNAVQSFLGGGQDGFITKFSQDGSNILYSTFLGGTKDDRIQSIAVNSNAKIYAAGTTASNLDFPIHNALQPDFGGGTEDVFLAILSADGTTLEVSTYLGGTGSDQGQGIGLDPTGAIVMTGQTDSTTGFPLVNPIQAQPGGAADAFVTKLLPDASNIVFSTYFGADLDESPNDLAVDRQGDIYITGQTESAALLTVNPIQGTYAGSGDAFLTQFSPDGSQVLFSTFFGGGDADQAHALAVDAMGNMYLAGHTQSGLDFPVQNPLQSVLGGVRDAFVAKLAPDNQPPEITSTPVTAAELNVLYNYAVEASDPDGDALTFSLTVFPDGMQIDPATGLITWTPDIAGEFSVVLQVADGAGEFATQEFTVAVNQKPQITSVPNTAALVGETYSYDVEAEDPDGDILVYNFSEFPPGMTIETTTGQISWIPTAAGAFSVVVTVDDGRGGSANQAYTLTVIQPNRVPVITSIPVTESTVDASYQYQITATDPDNDTLTYSLITAPLGMSINSGTGLINWLPVTAGNFLVEVNVDDNNGEIVSQTFQITVNFGSGTQPPGLVPIGDQTVPLGSTLTIQLSASDPDGNKLMFIAEPIPLAANMTLNASTGLFTFTPSETQIGTHQITFIASDGRFTDSETITITVPTAGGVTRLLGKVLTTGGAPLANVRLEIESVATFTDQNGNYLLDNLPVSGNVRLLVDGSTVDPALGTFATVPEVVNLITGADNRLEPAIILLPLDVASADPVDPFQTSIITSSPFVLADGSLSEPVTLTIPPGAAVNEDGTLFVGDIHISRIEDPTQGPRPLPDDIGLSVYIAIQPFGVLYPNPVPISFPNIEGFPPESIMDVFALNHDTGEFEKIGEARVSADGRTVDSIGGIVQSNSWHGLTPVAASVAQSGTSGVQNNQLDICEFGACTLKHESGNLGEDHSLPSYYSLGQARSVRLNYNSMNATPRPILNATSNIGNFSPPPLSMSSRLSVGGIEQGGERFSHVSTEPAAIRGRFKAARPSIQFDAGLIETGIYNYDWIVDCHFPISRRASTLNGQVIINNARHSALGAGWTLSGLRRIHINGDGLALMTEGNSIAITFKPIDSVSFTSPPADFSTLTRNPDNSFTRRMKDGTLYHFDTRGFQTQMVDRNNNITQYIYDSEDRIQRITDPVGKEFIFNYNSVGYLNTITDAASRTTRFEHDSEGNLTRIIEPTGDERSFEYQTNTHLLSAQTDQRGNRKEYTFDFAGRISSALLPDGSTITLQPSVTSGLIDLNSGIGTSKSNLAPAPPLVEDIRNSLVDLNGNLSSSETDERSAPNQKTDAVGRVTLTERDGDSNPTRTTRPNLSVIDRVYDDRGNVLSQIEQFNGAVRSYSYDDFSLITQVTNPNNHSTTINRNLVTGNVESVVNHLGHTATMTYFSNGLVKQSIDPNGLVTDYVYNAQELLKTRTETPPADSPGNVRITEYSYDAAGQLIQTITPDGIIVDLVYDNKGRLTSITDNLNQSIEYTYDGYNNLIQTDTQNADGNLARTVSQAFDTRNRQIETRAPHSGTEDSVIQQILDNNSNVTGLIDPNGNPSSNEFDGEDRITQNTHRLNGIATYEYDTNDRITNVVAPNGVATTYTYDVLGRRLTETSTDRGTLTYTYDLANNVTTITEGRGITATMTYDELERVQTKTYPNTIAGKNENVTYTYDSCPFGLGFLCARTDEPGAYDYEYDAFGNMTQGSFTEIAGVIYTMSYVYDDGNHIIQATYPSGRVVDYTRDGVRRVEAIDTTVNGTPQNIANSIQYRGDNQMTQCTYGNGLLDERQYDLQGRLTHQLLKDAADTVIDERTYSYDKNSNILGIDTNVEDNGYSYDQLDRVTGDTIDSNIPINYTYDLNDNRLTRQFEDLSIDEMYRYAANSNRVTEQDALEPGMTPTLSAVPNRELVYNDVGRLYQLFEEGALKAEYIYNDQGQRTRKVVHNPDLTTSITIYHYDHMGYLITETDETGQLIKDYIWTEGMHPIAQIDNNAGTESIIYLYTDHLMTNRLATDQSQAVVWRWEGEAFGNTPAQELAGFSVNLRFPGQYFDEESNLFYNHHRYFDPSTGRYITSDPIGLAGGLNPYLYAEANPIRYIDPLGLVSCPGGVWSVTGFPSVSAFFGGGISVSDVTYTCESTGKQCSATSFCFGGGPIIAAGFGADVKGRVEGVENSNQFSSYSRGAHISGGPISETITGSGATLSIMKSFGLGAAFVACTNLHLKCEDGNCN